MIPALIVKRRAEVWISLEHTCLYWIGKQGKWTLFDAWFLFGIIPICMIEISNSENE